MKNDTQSGAHILKGAMILSIATLLSRVMGILYRIPLNAAIGDVGVGISGMAYQVYTVILTLSSIALPAAISKLVSERLAVGAYRDAHRVYKVTLVYSTGVAFILAIALWFGADWIAVASFNTPEVAGSIKALVPSVLMIPVVAVIRGYFQGMHTMTPTAVSQVVEQFINVVVSIVLAYMLLSYSLDAAIIGSTFGTSVGSLAALLVMVFVYYTMRPTIKKRLKKSKVDTQESSWHLIKQIMLISIPIIVSNSVFALMGLVDLSMIQKILPSTVEKMSQAGNLAILPISDPQVLMDTKAIVVSLSGQFSNKYTPIINLPVGLILTLSMAVIPAIAAAMAKGDIKDVRRKTNMTLKIGMLFAAPSAIGVMVFGEQIIAFLFSSNPDGGKLLAYGGLSIIFITLAQLSTGILQGMGKQHIPTIHAVIACLFKVVCNAVLLSMPSVHIYGVIHATTLCYVVYALLNLMYLTRQLHLKLNVKRLFVKPMVASLLMGAVSWLIYFGLYKLIGKAQIALILVIPVACLLYGVIGLLTKTITIQDLENIPGGRKIIARFFKEV